MLFIISIPVLIRHLWLLKTVVFFYQCLISAVPFNLFVTDIYYVFTLIIDISLNRLINGTYHQFLLWMSVLLVARAKILAVKVGTSIHLACQPWQPACLVCARYSLSCFVEVKSLWTNMPWAIYFSWISMTIMNNKKHWGVMFWTSIGWVRGTCLSGNDIIELFLGLQ